MAISRIGAGAQGASQTSGGSVACAYPSAYTAVEKDLALIVVGGWSSDLTDPSAPSGYTLRSSEQREIGAFDLRLVTYWKKLTAGEAAPSFTVPASWSGNSGGLSAQMVVYRGVDPVDPFDVADATGDAAAASTWTPPAITPVTNNAVVVSAVSSGDDNALNLNTANSFALALSGASYDTTLGSDHAVGVADVTKAVAGLVTMCIWNQSAVGADPWCGITMALRPEITVASRVTRAMLTQMVVGDRGRVTRALLTQMITGDRGRITRAMLTLVVDTTARPSQPRFKHL